MTCQVPVFPTSHVTEHWLIVFLTIPVLKLDYKIHTSEAKAVQELKTVRALESENIKLNPTSSTDKPWDFGQVI